VKKETNNAFAVRPDYQQPNLLLCGFSPHILQTTTPEMNSIASSDKNYLPSVLQLFFNTLPSLH